MAPAVKCLWIAVRVGEPDLEGLLERPETLLGASQRVLSFENDTSRYDWIRYPRAFVRNAANASRQSRAPRLAPAERGREARRTRAPQQLRGVGREGVGSAGFRCT